MHSDLVCPIVEFPQRERVVKVLGVVRVYRACEDIPEILPLGVVLGCYLCRYTVGSVLDILRIRVWQAVLCEYGVHLGVVVACLSEDSYYLSDDVPTALLRPFSHSHHDLVVRLRLVYEPLGDNDVLIYILPLWCHVCHIVLHADLSDELLLASLQYLCHDSLFYVMVTACHHSHLHAVAIECEHGVALGYENRRLVCPVGLERVLSVALAYECTLQHLSLEIQPV